MGTGAKIAIGCGVVLIVGILGVTVTVVGGAYWVKGKAQAFSDEQKRITDLQEKANANTFTRPADSVVLEDRLLKFLQIRKRVFAVYGRHEASLAGLEKYKTQPGKPKENLDLGDVGNTYRAFVDLRLALAEAQAGLGMSDDEYRFLVEEVYLHDAVRAAGGRGGSLALPPANIALLRKYEPQIQQYAMPRLEWLGL